MKSLREIPGLLKRHYEKAILALALLGLIASVFYLNKMKATENEKIETYNRSIGRRKPKPVPSVDVSALQAALANSTNPPSHTFVPPHNLLNPVKWQRRSDGSLLKVETGKEIGPNALTIARIAPLNLLITLEGVAGNGFNMGVTQEGATNVYLRRKYVSYVSTNSATDRIHSTKVFTLREVNRNAEPPEAVIELADGTRVTVSTNKPFMRIMGYKADLKYSPEPNRNFNDRRVGDPLTLAGEDYNIVAITPNEVVVSARSNDRRTTIRNNAAQQ
jgi:hypothetical protein